MRHIEAGVTRLDFVCVALELLKWKLIVYPLEEVYLEPWLAMKWGGRDSGLETRVIR